jgi:hypothetical protein
MVRVLEPAAAVSDSYPHNRHQEPHFSPTVLPPRLQAMLLFAHNPGNTIFYRGASYEQYLVRHSLQFNTSGVVEFGYLQCAVFPSALVGGGEAWLGTCKLIPHGAATADKPKAIARLPHRQRCSWSFVSPLHLSVFQAVIRSCRCCYPCHLS